MSSGISLSSSSLYCGDGQESSAFVFSTIFSPFASDEADSATQVERCPVLCLFCGGYLNKFCKFTDDNSGRWTCSLCQTYNPPLFPSAVATQGNPTLAYPELVCDHVDYFETDGAVAPLPISMPFDDSSKGGFVFLLALAANICRDPTFSGLLSDMIATIPKGSALAIVILGERSSHVLRLISNSGSSSAEISSDAIPVDDSAVSYLHLFCRSGVHVIPVEKAMDNFSSIFCAIRTIVRLRPNRVKIKELVGSSMASLVALSAALSFTHPLGPGMRLVLLSTDTLTVGNLSTASLISIDRARRIGGVIFEGDASGPLPDHLKSSSRDTPSELGLLALSLGCWVDVFLTGTDSLVNVEALDALVGATGGTVVRAETTIDTSWRRSLLYTLSKLPSDFTEKGNPVTVEMRSCGILDIDHVVGPVMEEKEYYRVTGRSLRDSFVDEVHLIATVEAAKRNTAFSSRESLSLSSISSDVAVDTQSRWDTKSSYFEALGVSTLISRLKNSVSVQSEEQGANVSFDCNILRKDRMEILNSLRKASIPSAITYSLGRADSKTTITSQFRFNKDRKLKRTASDGSVGYCILQFIARIRGCSMSRRFQRDRTQQKTSKSSKVTRVWTICLPLTYEIPFFLRSLNEETWCVSVGRSIAADFHMSSLASVNSDQLSVLREEVSELVDNLVGEIVKYWLSGSLNFDQSCTEKIVNVCRILYYFREGPCIGGQLMDLQESYLTRSYFLTCSSSHALRIMFPMLFIFIPGPKQIMDSLVSVKACPGAMLCFPKSAFILDAGDSIYVWLGDSIDSNFSKSNVVSILSIAEALVDDRFPAAALKVVRSTGDALKLSFDERFIFARLSPTQQDLREVQLYPIASLCSEIEAAQEAEHDVTKCIISGFLESISTEVLDTMQERAPPTDQQSFMLYASSRAPKLYEYLKNQGKIGIIRYPQLVNLCPTVVDTGFGSLTAPRSIPPIDRNGGAGASTTSSGANHQVDFASAKSTASTMVQEKI